MLRERVCFGMPQEGDEDLVSPDVDWLRVRGHLLEGDSVADVKARIDRQVAAANRREGSASDAILELREQLANRDAALLRLQEELAARSETVDRLRNQSAELAAAVADRERRVTEASVEIVEMQAWIRELETRLVGRERRRRWWWRGR